MDPSEIRAHLEKAMRSAGGGAPESEAVVKMFMFGFSRTGEEDPKALAREIQGPLLEHLVKNMSRLSSAMPNLAKVGQILVIEWCWRNDYLLEDWKWVWRGKDGGDIMCLPRVPLSMIPIPKPDSDPAPTRHRT